MASGSRSRTRKCGDATPLRASASSERLGQRRQRAALECFLESGHEQFAMFERRRGVEQSRAREQIGARSRGGETAHQPREDVLLRHRGIPRQRGDHRVAIFRAVRFERPPAEQRNARIARIDIAAEQRGDQRQRLIRGQAARGAGELRAHFGVGLRGGEALAGGGEIAGKFLRIAERVARSTRAPRRADASARRAPSLRRARSI